MKYIIVTTPDADKDIAKLYKSGDKASIKKLEAIIKTLLNIPQKGKEIRNNSSINFQTVGQEESIKKTDLFTR